MLFVVMLQRGAVVEVIAQRWLQIDAKVAADVVFGTGSGVERPLPGAGIGASFRQAGTYTLLEHRAASKIDELYMLPTQGKLYKYDSMGINVIVNNVKGGINTCDVPYSESLEQFTRDYETLTKRAAEDCCEIPDEERIIIGTSAVMGTELDCIVNQYTGIFNNPFLVWSRYRRHWFRYRLTISLQFHHAQMDGSHAARFLEELQKTMKTV